MSIGIDKLAHMNTPALSDILLAHSAAEGTGVVAIGDLPKLLNAGNLKMPDSEETIAEHYRYMSGTQILINANFRNPINQRNQLKYTSTGYAIDMWRLNTFGDGFAELLPGVGIRLKSGPKATSAAGFNQQFEANLLGCIVTLSALDTQNRLLTVTSSILIDSSNWQVSKGETDFGWIGLKYNGNNVFEFAITSLDNTIVAARLELGPFQTLAHKDGSKWVLNDPPPGYATELAKCQRCQVIYSYPQTNGFGNATYIAVGIANSTTTARFSIETPVPLRTKPAVSMDGFYALRKTLGRVKVSGATPLWPPIQNKVAVQVTCDEANFTVGEILFLESFSGATLKLDANL